MCAWAYLSPVVARRYATGDYELKQEDWRSGRELWVVELLAPFGEGRRIINDLLDTVFAKSQVNYFRRRNNKVRVLKLYGAKHPARHPSVRLQTVIRLKPVDPPRCRSAAGCNGDGAPTLAGRLQKPLGESALD